MATVVKRKEQRETIAKRKILEKLDSGGHSYMFIKETPSAGPISFEGDVPFWNVNLHDLTCPDETDPEADSLLLSTMGRNCIRLTKRAEAMPFTRRHVNVDEVFFIHRGSATFYTEAGSIEAPTGRYIFISRGVGYRVIPESEDFMALILESAEHLRMSELCEVADLKYNYPTLPFEPEDNVGKTQWEERTISATWSVAAVREYDPVIAKQMMGDFKPVFGVDVDDIPVHNPSAPMPGIPFDLMDSDYLAWAVSKRAQPLPFYHRNANRTELLFIHVGNADQDTDLGYISAPVGSFVNLPMGIEHSPANRKPPLVNLILETEGEVVINPEILKKN